jgi:hypothetical protein
VWGDKTVVNLIPTLNTAKVVQTEEKNRNGEKKTKKPELIQGYNKFMQGVDTADQMVHYYPFCRKPVKWTKKFQLLLLEMAAQNHFI